ncbi:Lipase [Parasponia andersonii]|uniref:Lipase n=1 Tax=Parasponia andersonii TaxID=3476 RepID=A0A2P5BA10_PARAD|nr:Lipase [Parasponia andersonii]
MENAQRVEDMAKMVSSVSLVFLFNLISFVSFFSVPSESHKLAPALNVFGSSAVDAGNNNKFHTFAKYNYLPYGIDFPEGASGRPTNGYNLADYIAQSLGLEIPPPINSVNPRLSKNIDGFNYASSLSGTLNTTGTDTYRGVMSLYRQIHLFKATIRQQLKPLLKTHSSLKEHLAKSIFLLSTGVNDYSLTLLRNEKRDNESAASPRQIDFEEVHYAFSQDLVEKYASLLEYLYKLGARKFVVINAEAMGCLPYEVQKATPVDPVCVDPLNFLIFNFNRLLSRKISELGPKLPGTTFIIGNNYEHTETLVLNPTSLGLKEGFNPCCKVTKNGRCDAKILPCTERDEYAFFDGFNPTQAANKVFANECFNGTSGVCSPLNVQQLAAL